MTFICTICSDSLLETQDDRPCAIPCGHSFHKNCLTTWINLACKCPICNRKTKNTEIISPIYFSSDEDLTGKGTPELEALLQVTKLQQRDMIETLKESRIANKYLQDALKKSSNLAATISKNNAETTKKLTRELGIANRQLKAKQLDLERMGNEHEIMKLDLSRAKEEISTKEAEITRLKEEAKSKQAYPFTFKVPNGRATAAVYFRKKPQAVVINANTSKKSAVEVVHNGESEVPIRRLNTQAATAKPSMIPSSGKPSMKVPAAFASPNQQAADTMPFAPIPAKQNVSFGAKTTTQQQAAVTTPYSFTGSKQPVNTFGSEASNQNAHGTTSFGQSSSNQKILFDTRSSNQQATANNQASLSTPPRATSFTFEIDKQATTPAFSFGRPIIQAGAVTGSVYTASANQVAASNGQSFITFTQLEDQLAAQRNTETVSNGASTSTSSNTGAVASSSANSSFLSLPANAQFNFNF